MAVDFNLFRRRRCYLRTDLLFQAKQNLLILCPDYECKKFI
ncbi:MAG: hypothetical protein UT61_C0038G0004 [Candidatus Woesebacteria bacterium GW2011_GWA1_39_8]|uniref:Uncharacterized protein n=1 Tax=Candidatus Woesebacteria bacterium GW2011_GWA1_39_8 TaxID=1618552 RepID=A0A0G0PLX9_9BACT|nr:MAG: hypothetical protein UT61_C0038G0004 [Candidatus Woesebacteria bacterium GW2011_GWA1_39_8]